RPRGSSSRKASRTKRTSRGPPTASASRPQSSSTASCSTAARRTPISRASRSGGRATSASARIEAAGAAAMQAIINRADPYLSLVGLGWLVPLARLAIGDRVEHQLRELGRLLGVPLLAIVVFLALWAALAARIETSLGAIPGPAAVWQAAGDLVADHRAERERAA